MPKYKIKKDSVTVDGNRTSMLVTFTRDDGTASTEQRYEVESTDESVVYAELDKTAEGWEAMADAPVAPTLVTGKALNVGVETAKAQATEALVTE